MPLIDNYNRQITYLRISVTDRCNLRCSYCIPPTTAIQWLPREEILKFEEILRFANIAVSAGIKKIRISGGEPLLRRNLIELVSNLSKINRLEDLSLTTNGQLLKELARPLKQAGLNRINISLDSLKPDRYKKLTGGGNLSNVLKGINAAQAVGFAPIKINVVALKGINEDELLNFAELTIKHSWEVRFIELRPHSPLYPQSYLPIANIWTLINQQHTLKELVSHSNSTAQLFSFMNAPGTLGFIGQAEENLCNKCNRMRLTAAGQLYPCLFSPEYFDIKEILRKNGTKEEIFDLLKQAVSAKPPQLPSSGPPTPMFKIGG